MSEDRVTLADLERIVAARAQADAGASYTRSLLDKGISKCAQKLGEEAVETALAAVGSDKAAVISETADLLYHLAVLLHAKGVELDEVHAELARRTRQSGHEEKASRQRS
ncbi:MULTISPECIES: phosphoribosyl-ATP diphosphatase [Azorhizobium]|uniref:Phosphoribosyl-ATP pyrophosphatase n=1 Tax=Azorhizobium caulinodans (strain ATCC 43989 / DSM 5975 / JCM 20966 / LMG 6465 / NBRC 14845 / NCIMB 13405 / ORS 571) TaxID=438753 RepID=HIS2_AZOC5|nr:MULTISPECIES: phosphoribosyl-ATP diphosphatase [Azorhizobium]A8HYT3.1 RecName: Full=Phosphoribosyl-ATP pyrophosphatase; Short=PRA-PH [Azorhizobium caulinodans ORS 571]TDT91209.1 phosphoribosyl-ATP pyrophosphatase [Azorhizobium sp. AG788]BAF90495.1 phosphoribosyl-ATP pyrophosphohydrolase [Azorhizobium caulinodans ORS 571]